VAVDRSETIRWQGLKEFRLALKELELNLERDLSRSHKAVADVVARKARAKGAGLGSVAAKAAPSISASGVQLGARVVYGGAEFPFMYGAEFGAIRYPQFQPWLGHEGYFLFPTIRETRDETIAIYAAELERITKKAFPD